MGNLFLTFCLIYDIMTVVFIFLKSRLLLFAGAGAENQPAAKTGFPFTGGCKGFDGGGWSMDSEPGGHLAPLVR